MKAVIVSASTLAKHNRLDAGFYCNRIEGVEIDEAIKRAKAQLDAAAKRLVTLCQRKQALAERIAKMIRDGEIYPVDTEEQA